MKRLTAWKVWWKVLPLPGNGSLGRPTPTSCPQFGILTLKWLFNLWRWLTIYQSEDQSQSSKSSPRQRSSAGIHPDGDLGVNINMNYVITTHPLLSPLFHSIPLQYPFNTPQHPSPLTWSWKKAGSIPFGAFVSPLDSGSKLRVWYILFEIIKYE